MRNYKYQKAYNILKENPVWVCRTRVGGVVVRVVTESSRDIESLRGRMGESAWQVEGLFESLLAQSFDGG